MKKRGSLIVVFIVALVFYSFPVYAARPDLKKYSSINVESELLPGDQLSSKAIMPRSVQGTFFAAADLKIGNRDGEIGVTGHAYMDNAVDELYMTIYLDRLEKDANGNDVWQQIEYYDFEFYGEDYPDGLKLEGVEFVVTNVDQGKYYRLRGAYAAVQGDLVEAFSLCTDGVLIEKGII